ncbi:RNA polymerase recycling motor HelD [Desmospora profundinema]|uniref:DNA helicase-2/ATP-dependent DNA helicase PcrA n=1 Tax=Desmospora profundinema TaxID=1571184 RepID=A0ABU1IJP0_9BACL|nr:RNA polymerase recycling motor HelD [Desmospora profundinema]MDR6224981.1 DNA helicase-2/ATP-dependent DNA helicase PcrA [Desmospora profundinema]
MSLSEQEWRKEQKRVDRVIQTIHGQMTVLQKEIGGVKADIVDIRKHFWDDIRVNVDDPGEAAETYASIKQQAEVLSERERRHRHAQKRLKTLEKLHSSPYFGRIDFVEDGEPSPQRIYLGLTSLLNENKEEFLIYDWRAPVSSLYYDYGPGPAQYDTPDGTITGTMELKRQYIIRDGRIRSLFDTGVTIGDELLQEVLGRQAGTQMKTIVATIQREQNQIIRSEGKRLLIVQGSAGSGKTSAALQRVAYLLYRHRETLKADQILLFSPNPMFNSYVSTVLPELGEENMAQTTFQEYLERHLGQTFQLEDPFTQMETVFTTMDEPGYAFRIEGIRFKSSHNFMAILDRYLSWLQQTGLIFKHIKFRGKTLVSATQIRDRFYSLDQALSIPQRMEHLVDWLLKELKKQARLEQTKPWVEEAIQFLDSETYGQVYRKLLRKQSFTEDTFDDYEREQRLLAEGVVQERFKPLVTGVKQLRFIDIPAIYRQLFTDPALLSKWSSADLPRQWKAIAKEAVKKLDRFELSYEDATPYLYLKEKIEGFQTVSSVRHVLIDEAQDYSPFQFQFIKELFPRASLTVLGDLNQSIHPHAAGTDFASLSSLYGAEQTEVIRLTRSYRSTQPIVQFTRWIIPGGEAIQPFNRDGKKPTVTKALGKTDLAHKIADRIRVLQAAGHRTIAVIGKTARECREAFEALHDEITLRLIDKETASFQTGAVVIPSYLAKGVEFDAVILYDASRKQYGRKSERTLFYTACTRAMHELHLFYTGEKSPLLAPVPAELYVEESE